MFVHKIYDTDDWCFENVDDAIKFMQDNNYNKEVAIYDINDKKAWEKVRKIYDTIEKYNEGRPLMEQILPTNPFSCRAIRGCLGVQMYSIGLGTYERNRGCIALFTGYNDFVLDRSVVS